MVKRMFYFSIIVISLTSCKCVPVRETKEDCDKRMSDIRASNWILRSKNASLDSTLTVRDSTILVLRYRLRECGCDEPAQ
jgi:hypothetical protein